MSFSTSSSLITMVSPILLKILCLFLFVKIHPRIKSIGNRNDLPKLEITILFKSAFSPFKFVIFKRKAILPID